MRSAMLVTVLAAARIARAEPAMTVRLPPGAVLDATGTRAMLAWGAAQLALELTVLDAPPGPDARDPLATALGTPLVAPRERLRAPWRIEAFVPRTPPRIGDRELLLVAELALPSGGLGVAAFYVDAPGFDDTPRFTALARSIAATLAPARASAPVVAEPSDTRVFHSPRGGWCEGHDEPRVVLTAPARHEARAGTMRGHDLYWFTWRAAGDYRGETTTPIGHRLVWHVVCHARSAADREALLDLAGARFDAL